MFQLYVKYAVTSLPQEQKQQNIVQLVSVKPNPRRRYTEKSS